MKPGSIQLSLLFLGILLCATPLHPTADSQQDFESWVLSTLGPNPKPWFRIQALRAHGRLEEALDAAKESQDLLKPGMTQTYWQLPSWDRLIATIELLKDLPPTAQREMRQADSLWVEYFHPWYQGKYSMCADLMERRLEILLRYLGDQHEEVARCRGELAACLSHQGDYARAEPLFRQAIDIQLKLPGQMGAEYTLEYLGELYAAKGDLDRAEPLYQQALEVLTKKMGELEVGAAPTDLIRLWARIADLHIRRGDYARAMPMLRRGLAAMHSKPQGTAVWLIALLLNQQAIILWRQGDHAAAEPVFREALALRRKDLGEEHPHTIQSLNVLGEVLSQSGEPAVAEPLLRESLEHFRCIREGEHPDIARAVLSLATLMRSRGNYVAADSLCREALALCRRFRGGEHVDVAECHHHLATTQVAQGKLEEAEANLREALETYRRLLSNSHPDVVETLHDLGRCALAQGRTAVAEPLLAEAADAFETARLRVGSGYARATFQDSPYAALATTRLRLGKIAEAWPAVERAHGRALADLLIAARHRSLSADERAEQDSLQWILSRLEGELAALQEAARTSASEQPLEARSTVRARLAIAEAAWSALQADLAAKHPELQGFSFPLERVQAALPDRTALVGWLHLKVSRGDFNSWGYVIGREGPVHWVRLDSSSDHDDGLSPIEKAHDFRDALAVAASWTIKATDVDRFTGDAADLYERWVAPLLPHLEEVEHLVVIPSGPMSGIPLEILVDGHDEPLADRYTISYVPSATLHTLLLESSAEEAVPSARNGLLVGDPPFTDEQLTAMAGKIEQEQPSRALLGASAEPFLQTTTLRSAVAGSEEALARLPRLPRTREEVERVASTLGQSTILLGPDASEDRLIALAESGALRRFDTIHLATHALVDDERPERSALVLSRANLPDPFEAILAGTGIQDGLLTAKEIVREWELDADLVTLSGCQTGLGRETAEEGYIGLAQAFLQAGARSILVSLWKVEEEATSLLMGRFYENLTGAYKEERGGRVGEPMSKAQALREAKHWLRQYTDGGGRQPFVHPTYWSGFVLIGDS